MQPNPHLSGSLTTGLAWLNAWSQPENLRSFKEFDLYWKGASESAKKHGYSLEEFRLAPDGEAKRLHQILQDRGIRGILLPPQSPHPDWDDFPWTDYSIVRFGRSLKSPACHIVTADQAVNTMLAFEKIRERGYSRIGFVDESELTVKIGHMFRGGFLLAQSLVDQSARVPILDLCNIPRLDRPRMVADWIAAQRVDAVFTGMVELPELLAEAGLRVPEDIAFATTTVNDIPNSAGIDQHPEEIGRVGVLMLNSLINDGARGIPDIFRQILVEGSWVDGASLPSRI
jgi:DNA-binding LacI/PurR family transcriptional regulator